MTPYSGQKNDYAAKTPVSAIDLNRRANLFDAQVYGALDGLGFGIIENEGGTSLKVFGAGGTYVANAGSAVILSDGSNGLGSHPVYGRFTSGSVLADEDTPYIHAKLVVGGTPTSPDTELGTALLQIVASEDETIPGALLLAEWQSGGTVIDRRTFIKADEALRRLAQVIEDVGYDATARAKGTVAARLDAFLSTDDDAPTGAVTREEFNAIKNELADVKARLALVEGKVNGGDYDEDFPTVEDTIIDHVAVLAAGLAEVNPSSVNRGQISVVVANAGHGQFDTPDYTPTTNDDNEMPFNTDDGTVGA